MPHKLLSHTECTHWMPFNEMHLLFSPSSPPNAMCNMQIEANGKAKDEKPTTACMHACDGRVKYVLRCPLCQCATDSNAAQRQHSTSHTKGHPSFDRHNAMKLRSTMYLLLASFRCLANRVREPTAIFGATIFIGEKVKSQFCGVSHRLPRAVAHRHLPI